MHFIYENAKIHKYLLFHSHTLVITGKFFELKREIKIFFFKASYFQDKICLANVVYLVDRFSLLNELNLNKQGSF